MPSKAIGVKELLILLLLFILINVPVKAQILPSITVNTIQQLKFGAFTTLSNGGTVIVSATGSRSVTGNIIALNMGAPVQQAIIEVQAVAGTIISIVPGADAVLTGSNGGTITLHIGSTQPASPFVITQSSVRVPVNIGGTLTVNNLVLNKAGNYSGTFNMIFISQ